MSAAEIILLLIIASFLAAVILSEWVLANVTPVFGGILFRKESLPGGYNFFHLTNFSKKRIEQKEGDSILVNTLNNNLHSILENANRAYILFDRDFKVVAFNRLGAQFTKTFLDVEIKEGMDSIGYFPVERQRILERLFKNALNGIPATYEVGYPLPDGTKTWFDVHIHSTGSQAGGIVMALSDITEKKMMIMQLEKMASDLVEKNKNLEQFAYMVSHNLRAPLANIIGLCEELESGDLPETVRAEFLNGVLISSKRLDEVIIDMNQVLQIKEDLNEKKEMVSLSQILTDVSSFNGIGGKATIMSNFTECDEFFGVKTYLFSIFYNLISNSISYKNPEKPPVISITSSKYKNKLILSFKDNGIGIDMDKYGGNVFGFYKRFHQVSEGKGLGLFITRTHVESMGGTISVNSTVNEGSEFRIEFNA